MSDKWQLITVWKSEEVKVCLEAGYEPIGTFRDWDSYGGTEVTWVTFKKAKSQPSVTLSDMAKDCFVVMH